MSEQQPDTARPVGTTEFAWCKAVPGGTGITVLALLLYKPPNLLILQNALDKLQITHPILRSTLSCNTSTNSFSFFTPPSLRVRLQLSDPPSETATLQSVLEHELNINTWRDRDFDSEPEVGLFFATIYDLGDGTWVLALRLHTAACDRTSASELLRKMLEIVGGSKKELEENGGVGLGIEDLVPRGKERKPFWARGVDMLGYSLNSFRLSNMEFVDAESARGSRVVRLRIGLEDTTRLVSSCKSRNIGLCGALAAAGLIAARLSKSLPDEQWEKYAVVTLIDCRSILDPALTSQHLGFYHSAILNTHDVRGNESLWELAERTYKAFSNAKANNKHFSDMADLNFLMCKAIDNPGLTPSSSMRTSFISVFEDPIIDLSNEIHQQVGVRDYIGCASVHGVGPSIAIFDMIRDGELDCACVYPSPLHSQEQMEKLVADMERVLVDASENESR